MNRPFIFCHMLTSADGRIHGNYMHTPELKDAEDVFYDLAFGRHAFYRPNAWICGRVTTEDMFTEGRELRLDEGSETVPAGDFINTRPFEDFYYVALDGQHADSGLRIYLHAIDHFSYLAIAVCDSRADSVS